jgi:hypothetical protein
MKRLLNTKEVVTMELLKIHLHIKERGVQDDCYCLYLFSTYVAYWSYCLVLL